jgi:dolichol-phosphate mannosyltransferase
MNNNMFIASVILPTYNESKNLPLIIPEICRVLEVNHIKGEVIVVDDNSPDGTGEVAQSLALQYPVQVLIRKNERGLATAVIAGFEMSRSEVCVVMDADGSHPVEKLPDMINPILQDKADITVGSRHVKDGGIGQWPLHRQIISKAAAMMARGVTTMTDPTSGFMAIRRSLLERLELNPIGWKIVLEVVVKVKSNRLMEVPITFKDRKLGESKMSLKEQLNYIKHLLNLYKYKRPGVIEFFNFCSVGFSGVFVDTGVVIALKTFFGFDTLICAVFGFCAAVTTNYYFNRQWTFEGAHTTPVVKSYAAFVAVCCLGLLSRLGVMHLFIIYTRLDEGYYYIFNNFIGIAAGTIVNYWGSKYFAFSQKKPCA